MACNKVSFASLVLVGDMSWVLKVLGIVFRIEFKDMEGCRYSDCSYLCVLGDFMVCV